MIGVVIPSAGRSTRLFEAIESVAGFPLIVVDDSKDGRIQLEGITVIRTDGEQGFARAANMGLIEMQKKDIDRVLILNDDAVMEHDGLASIEREWSDNDGALAPVLHEPDGPVYGIRVHSFGRVHLAREPGPVQALSGASLFLRASERFDPNYVHGFEDIELCRRLVGRNLHVRCVQTVHCHHGAGETIARRSRTAQRHAMHGHVRFTRGGLASVIAVVLAILQVVREGGPADRLLGIVEGLRDYFRADPLPLP